MEVGDNGIAFKEEDRLQSVSDIGKENTHIALIGGQIVGVILIDNNGGRATLGNKSDCLTQLLIFSVSGPLAVAPARQG